MRGVQEKEDIRKVKTDRVPVFQAHRNHIWYITECSCICLWVSIRICATLCQKQTKVWVKID